MAALIVVFVLSISQIINADEVVCSAGSACTCQPANAGETCVFNCATEDQCKGAILTCRAGDPCFIRCEAKSTCSDTVIVRGLQATDLTINCVGDNSCKDGITIACGTGDCLLHCDQFSSCASFGSVNTAASKSFQCTGSCPADGLIPLAFSPSPTLSPSTVPTTSPSKFPSIPPTKNPSLFPTTSPTKFPSKTPTANPSTNPSKAPTKMPSSSPSVAPTDAPTMEPTMEPTTVPSGNPTPSPSHIPTSTPSGNPSVSPTAYPSKFPTNGPTNFPTANPTNTPSARPTIPPTSFPTTSPSTSPSHVPSERPTQSPSDLPSASPSQYPSQRPSQNPSLQPSDSPSRIPTSDPSEIPTTVPTNLPTFAPVMAPTQKPSTNPTETTLQTDGMSSTVMIEDGGDSKERSSNVLISNFGNNSNNWLVVMLCGTALCFICVALVKIMKWRYDKNKHKDEQNDKTDAATQEMTLIQIKNNDNGIEDELEEDEYCVVFERQPFGLVFTNKYDKKNIFIKDVVSNSIADENNVIVGSKIIKFGNENVEDLGGKNIQKMFANKFAKRLPLKITFRKPSEYLVSDVSGCSLTSNVKLMSTANKKNVGDDDEMQKMSLITAGESRSNM